MNETYKFSIPNTISQVISVIMKDGELQHLNDSKMILSTFWLKICNENPDCNFEDGIKKLFEIFSEDYISDEFILKLDNSLTYSKNVEIRDSYLKYPLHDCINDELYQSRNLTRYKTILNNLKISFQTINSDSIINLLIAKNVLDMMIDNEIIYDLLSVIKKEGLAYRLLNFRRIQSANKTLKLIKEKWDYYMEVASEYIQESEKIRYDVLLGDKLSKL